MRINSKLKKSLLAALFLIVIYALIAIVLRTIGLENAQNAIRKTGVWVPVLFVILCTMSLIVAPLSGSSLFVVGGALFGKETGFILSWLASIIGCSVNFWISRKFGRGVANHFVGKSNLDNLDRFAGRFKNRRGIFIYGFINAAFTRYC